MKEYEKILYVKSFIRHIKVVKAYDLECTDPDDGSIYTIPVHKNVYTELKEKEYNKIKAIAEEIKENKIKNKARQQEIEIELKSELLTDNKRKRLINEYNDLALAHTTFDSVGFVVPDYTEELAEALDLLLYAIDDKYILTTLSKNYFDFNLGLDNKFDLDDIHNVVYSIFKSNMKKGWSFNSIFICYNALLLHYYSKCWQEYYDACISINEEYPNEMNSLIEYLDKIKQPHGFIWNLYTMFSHMLEGIDIDEFIKYYPITKNIDPYGCCKDYNSSIKAIKMIKEEYGNILDDKSSKIMLSEVEFAEPVLFGIALKMFEVIGYDTNINTGELLLQFLSEAHEEVNKTSLKVIKGEKDNE